MIRIATFNVENLDDKSDDKNPPLEARIPTLRGALRRMNADILCLQEVHGQELAGHTSAHPVRDLLSLKKLIETTPYEKYHLATTTVASGVPRNERNLVVLSRFPIGQTEMYRNDFIKTLQYEKVTATGASDNMPKPIGWERPILHCTVSLPSNETLHVIDLHLKSRLATHIHGQYDSKKYRWHSAAGWAEGYFLSSLKRVGQALEVRQLLDAIFDRNTDAKIVVCGDFNAEPGEVPVEAICGRVENTGNPALRSRVMVPCSAGIPESVRFSHLHHGKGNLLDHMLLSQSLLAHFQSAHIFNENLHDESLPFAFDDKYPESDHAPLVSVFDM